MHDIFAIDLSRSQRLLTPEIAGADLIPHRLVGEERACRSCRPTAATGPSTPGFLVGIGTPWALINTDNWITTHHPGSRTTMAIGAAIVAVAVLPIEAQARAVAVCVALAVMVIPPVVFCWWLWRRNSAQA